MAGDRAGAAARDSARALAAVDADLERHEAVLHQPASGRKTMQIIKGKLHEHCDEALSVLVGAGVVYRRGDEIITHDKSGRLYPFTPAHIATELARLIAFEKYDSRVRDCVSIDCPDDLAKKMLAMVTRHAGVPELRAVITASTMTADGHMIETPGYDPRTKLLLHPSGVVPPVPEEPDAEDIKAAIEFLWEPFSEFPYVDSVSRGVHLSALLSAAMRLTVGKIPAHGYSAPAAGTGKTLMAQCISVLAGDFMAPVVGYSANEEENEKRLLSYARSGAASILIDNISGVWSGDAYCAFLTSEMFRSRILKESKDITVPADALVLGTGNNLQPSEDMCRRVMICKLDARNANPDARAFALDPKDYCRRNRLALIRAALTIVRGYLLHGKPSTKDRTASFEGWSDVVRQAVCWIGAQRWLDVADPVKSIAESKASDPERIKLAGLYAMWRKIHQGSPKRLSDIVSDATFSRNDPDRVSLAAVLDEIAGEHGKINVRRLGRWVERHAGQIVDGLVIRRAGVYEGTVRWAVERAD